LLVRLAKANVGCYVGTFFAGALAYADDIVVLAPTASAMRNMLQICDEYAAEFSISFNANKSKCLIAAPRRRRYLLNKSDICSFSVGGKSIEFVDFFTHLGHVISSDLDDCRDVANRRCSFIGQTNSVLCDFGKLDSNVRYRLFRSYCSSNYGCELWLLDNSCVQDFCVAWRKGLRRIWNLPYNSHGDVLCGLSGDIPIFDEICRRSMRFAAACLQHGSSLMRFLVQYGILFAPGVSVFGRNINICAARYKFKVSNFLANSVNVNAVVRCYCYNLVSEDRKRIFQFLRDLVSCRDWYGRDGECILSRDEICDIIHYLSVE